MQRVVNTTRRSLNAMQPSASTTSRRPNEMLLHVALRQNQHVAEPQQMQHAIVQQQMQHVAQVLHASGRQK